MTDMNIIIKTAAELRPGDTYVVGVNPYNVKTGASGLARDDRVLVVAIGVSYIDRYGDRYVPVTVIDRYGANIIDKPADSLHTVVEGDV